MRELCGDGHASPLKLEVRSPLQKSAGRMTAAFVEASLRTGPVASCPMSIHYHSPSLDNTEIMAAPPSFRTLPSSDC